jgi:hypothetical protein
VRVGVQDRRLFVRDCHTSVDAGDDQLADKGLSEGQGQVTLGSKDNNAPGAQGSTGGNTLVSQIPGTVARYKVRLAGRRVV